MSKTLKVAGVPAVDPTLPKVSLTLNGREWHLCFTYAALAIAEARFRKDGLFVNMLLAMDMRALGAERLPIVLFAGLVSQHPEITFSEVQAMVTIDTFNVLYDAVIEAYVASCPSLKELKKEKKNGDPTEEPVE